MYVCMYVRVTTIHRVRQTNSSNKYFLEPTILLPFPKFPSTRRVTICCLQVLFSIGSENSDQVNEVKQEEEEEEEDFRCFS